MISKDEEYLIIGVEDGWIKVNKNTWNNYKQLKVKKMENISLQTIIKMAFPRGLDRIIYRKRKPQAHMLERTLKILQTKLATQDINLMIDWAYGKYKI